MESIRTWFSSISSMPIYRMDKRRSSVPNEALEELYRLLPDGTLKRSLLTQGSHAKVVLITYTIAVQF
ncbi:hypothetical protein RB195_016974 [Necator americanus]|uniref:Uncharacterized protein n=1 Tax=Necator americanus TaxID=51031 RepID=A0ABR1C303_NECAM